MDTFGYARVSTQDQNLARQLKQLKEYGCDKIYQEKKSGKNIEEREELQKLLSILREDDELVIASLDRLSRNYDDIQAIVKQLRNKGVKFTVLDMPYMNNNSNDPLFDKMMQDLFISVMGFVSQNEREKIKDRQRQGIELAKQRGAYKGRQTEYCANSKDPQKRLIYNTIVDLLAKGEPKQRIAKQTGVSRPTVYKIEKEMQEKIKKLEEEEQ